MPSSITPRALPTTSPCRSTEAVRGLCVRQLRANAFRVIDSLQVMSIATNLGDTKTIVAHPATTSHGRLTDAQRSAAGVTQGLIRVAVGLEHIDDITADLARGLNTF